MKSLYTYFISLEVCTYIDFAENIASSSFFELYFRIRNIDFYYFSLDKQHGRNERKV